LVCCSAKLRLVGKKSGVGLMKEVYMFKRIDHVALQVSDIDASKQFYQENFGFSHYYEHKLPANLYIAYLTLGDTMLELYQSDMDSVSHCATAFHFCLVTDNFSQDVQQLLSKGVRMQRAPHATAPRVAAESGWQRATFLGLDDEEIEIRG
jgi:lactoylglutathione lyase